MYSETWLGGTSSCIKDIENEVEQELDKSENDEPYKHDKSYQNIVLLLNKDLNPHIFEIFTHKMLINLWKYDKNPISIYNR